MAKLPLNLSKTLDAWKQVSAEADESAGIVLAGDDRLVEVAQQRFSLGGAVPATWIGPPAEVSGRSSGPGEILMVLVRAEGEAEVLATLKRSMPKGGAVVVVDESPRATGKVTYPGRHLARVSFSDSSAGWRQVFAACAAVAGERTVALGRRYPVLRAAAARRVVTKAAGQNALIGVVFFVPGADMPVMTLNQIKMVLSIAGVYGEDIGVERALELAAVVGMGFGFRALARALVRTSPGVGWVFKAVTGYAATMAVGLAAARYFEKGAPASTSRVVALAGSLRR